MQLSFSLSAVCSTSWRRSLRRGRQLGIISPTLVSYFRMGGDRVREKGREREPVIYVTHSLIHPPGQMIDGPQNGPAPGPWDIAVQPTKLFQNSQNHFEVPHTASVKVCHGCTGNGFNRCSKCLGRGKVSPVISG